MTKQRRYTRKVVRVDAKTGEVVRFPTVKAARESVGTNIGMSLINNRPTKGYRFYYEEEWEALSGG